MDLDVENSIIVEIKAIEQILKIHEAQLLSYLKLYQRTVGLLLNFHSPILKSGIKRIVNNFLENSASRRLGGSNLLEDFNQ